MTLKHKNLFPEIPLKTSIEIAKIRKAGQLLHEVLEELRKSLSVGMRTEELDWICENNVRKRGLVPALKGYCGYPSCLCVSVNNVAAHGIPSSYIIQQGDLVCVDCTVSLEGWHADAARTWIVGRGTPDARRILKASYEAMMAGIGAAKAGSRFGDIGSAIRKAADRYGCAVLENFVGHGIGRNLHEEPVVLHTGEPDTGMPIVPGMVFTVEPILSLGSNQVKTLKDGWSVVTLDNALTAQFEHTVAVFSNRTEILTRQQT